MRLCKVGSHVFTWDGRILTLVRRVNGKYVATGTYDPKKGEFLGMSDAARRDAIDAYDMISKLLPNFAIDVI